MSAREPRRRLPTPSESSLASNAAAHDPSSPAANPPGAARDTTARVASAASRSGATNLARVAASSE